MTLSLKLVIHLCISVVVLLGATSESHAHSSCFYPCQSYFVILDVLSSKVGVSDLYSR